MEISHRRTPASQQRKHAAALQRQIEGMNIYEYMKSYSMAFLLLKILQYRELCARAILTQKSLQPATIIPAQGVKRLKKKG